MSQNNQLFNKKALMLLLLGVVGLYAHHDVSAATTCSFTSGGAVSNAIPLMAQNITVGPDTPNGTIVFHQYTQTTLISPFRCTASSTAYKATVRYVYTANPKPLSSWNDSPYPGAVYETGVPGLGVVFWYYGVRFPSDRSVNNVPANVAFGSGQTSPIGVAAEFDMYIIKIGPVSAGTIKGGDLPSASVRLIPEGGNTLLLSSMNFTGSINIVSQTCQTPDVNVTMGKVGITTFKGKGTASAWQDASIRLTNCPRFYGTKFVTRDYISTDPRPDSSANSANSLSLNLTPNTSIIDSAKGIMGIKAGAGSASGVGIQLAFGQVSDTSPTVVSFANSRSYTMTNDSSTTQTLPLVARYIQTDDQVTPGRADGTATFTINYY